MHQHPRPSPRSASAASNPTTNPERTNNSRDRPPQRTRSSVDLASYTEKGLAETSQESSRETASGSQDREATKLNQIIQVCNENDGQNHWIWTNSMMQHFHSKAALTICSARANLPSITNKAGEIKQNRWVSCASQFHLYKLVLYASSEAREQ